MANGEGFSRYIGRLAFEAIIAAGFIYQLAQNPINWTNIAILIGLAYIIWKSGQ